MNKKKRVLTGDRPTGKLHLGHWVGSIKNRLDLQNNPAYDCFFIVADLHTLTTRVRKEQVLDVDNHIYEVLADWLSVGIDPNKSTIYLQSAIPEIYELHLLFSMLISINRIMGIPSLKEMAKNASIEEGGLSLGLVGYPVLQSADILLAKAQLVPVGKDNEAHIELTRDIARNFNRLYGEIFPEPETLQGELTSLVGIDGQGKMSKSANNAIYLSDDDATIKDKIRKMYTDPNRIHATTPGRVEGNPLFIYHDIFNPNKEEVEEFKTRYRQGCIKDVEVKARLAEELILFLQPFKEKRAELLAKPHALQDALQMGTEKMRALAKETMEEVRDTLGLSHKWRSRLLP
ncbi:tryptophan--tRNA ligase [Chlamydia psittaci]|uniref:Tryptophan--tRNA ligase n=1 Tax=Chlamydia psittaci 99DC5 TaxID=1112251 RepID=A0ABN0MQI1_CHLPS|nr:tryptophan--tRNA ligase [Chlamydia psittaci]AFS20048.1 tryptophanyl-tRNA synthetase [Chlamydia psittaci 84/55]AGE75539.1 tryptophanyl-tRNA synthetase [Chlamydia psittaci Mat116]EPJ16197.1 tryptophan--tRNA ligase [Chlamydia psittaci 02DC18]EPJ17321.1 tryptophan--tRNA ligase [Chlamydia psittaci 02DC22]EPJ19164.1 tryptophan--tRNA ligase [Chlamydia psittaci 03DC29]EPJ19628.1 tryptophan--tRNA ligase [Chlamydia psittaci 02DC23]EPJ20733.1 tryptophan--tRNA ligase [Chlamydia psittaci 02DC21]EPJ99